MPHIAIDKKLPGIRAILNFRPEIAAPLSELTNTLLRDNEGLSMAERELIAMHVSHLNDCFYCYHSHAAIACEYLHGNVELVEQVTKDYESSHVSGKLKALLAVAGSVQKGGKFVTPEQVASAKSVGATDREIHDTVLIAALFCLFNRYVDGLAATTPTDLSTYPPRAREVAAHGYGRTATGFAHQ
jgi:uncharacterized peroxidase-related enzyme